MDIIRSFIFNVVLFAAIFIGLLVSVPVRLCSRDNMIYFWIKFSYILHKITELVGGISCKFEDEHYLIQGPAIYAIRHESMWETMMLIYKFRSPVFVLKQELLKVPLFGATAKHAGVIAVDREHGARSLVVATKQIAQALSEGHSVIIFPEGTRVPNGKHVPIKRGIGLFYTKLKYPVVPVVHNSGKFWPRRGFIKHPGTITVRFLEPIQPGLSLDEFMIKINNVFHDEVEQLQMKG